MRALDMFRTFSRYNAWMNTKLYELSARLSDDERRRDRGAFFRSIHGTLGHILVADRLWMGRFTAMPYAIESLDADPYPRFADLQRERALTDRAITQWVEGLNGDDVDRILTYTSVVNPEERSCTLGFALQHFFNHQTHHRGQATTLLMQAGADPGVTDLMWMPAGDRVGGID